MSPEQVLGRPLDYRSDLWQIAMIAFECVTGARAFAGSSLGELFMKICTAPLPIPSQIAPVPVGFDAWFARASNRDPNGRFQSVRELVETLALVLLRSGPGGPATLPLGATKETEIMDPPAHAAWSSGASGNGSAKRALTIALAVLPILAAGVAGAVWIVAGRDTSGTAPNASASRQGSDPVPGASQTAPAIPNPTPGEVKPAASAAGLPTDGQDAGAPSMQNGPDAGRGPRSVKKNKEDVLGF
jgi:eukaryotic-like serine/threonine-protein kinase